MKQIKTFMGLATATAAVAGLNSCCGEATKSALPNVVFIMADDLGYGDLGCYGQEIISTPNIDKLAAKGMLFTQNYAGCTVSAPSRCSIMTGLHTGHTNIRGNKELEGEGQEGMPADIMTIAKVMKSKNYTTGAFGKWGLGYPGGPSDPNMQGFDEFFGYNCQRQAHRYYPEHLWHNQEKVMLPGNEGFKRPVTFAPTLIQEQTLKFIKDNKNNPFFAYVSIVQPHAELLTIDNDIYAQYDGKFENETPWKADTYCAGYGDENFNPMYYSPQEKPRTTFAAMVSQVDAYVGEIMAELEEQGIADNTLVFFTSDNGPHTEGGADPDFFNSNGPLTGYKRSMTDGGIRVPLIAYWDGVIAPGQTTDHISAFWDLMPTLADIAGAETPSNIDGISYLPTLLGKGEQKVHDYLYWEHTGSAAVRWGDWKAIRMSFVPGKNDKIQLYNLKEDIGETNDVAAEHPELVAKAEALMAKAHTPNPLFPLTLEEIEQSQEAE